MKKEKFVMPEMPQELIEKHMKDHVESSRRVFARRKAEVEAVLGPVPTFTECEAAFQKALAEREQAGKK